MHLAPHAQGFEIQFRYRTFLIHVLLILKVKQDFV